MHGTDTMGARVYDRCGVARWRVVRDEDVPGQAESVAWDVAVTYRVRAAVGPKWYEKQISACEVWSLLPSQRSAHKPLPFALQQQTVRNLRTCCVSGQR